MSVFLLGRRLRPLCVGLTAVFVLVACADSRSSPDSARRGRNDTGVPAAEFNEADVDFLRGVAPNPVSRR